MELTLWRYSSDADSTLGLLFEGNGAFGRTLLCYTCEDAHHTVKVHGQTRIPAGTYRIKLRTESLMATRYRQRIGPAHRGMLWLQDVPGFEWVYIHTGNDEDDTLACILVGENRSESRRNIQQSRVAYERIYSRIAEAADSGTGCSITILDLDRLPHPQP